MKTHSWNWRALLRLRPLAKRFMKGVLGNGQDFFFWHDPWTPFGSLLDYIGTQGPRNMRIRQNEKVAQACNHEGWNLPAPRSEQELQLHKYLSTIQLPSEAKDLDSYVWIINGVTDKVFSSSGTWEAIRSRGEKNQWAKIVWFPAAIHAHAFHFWITNWNRLPTKLRISQWSARPIPSPLCVLCSSQEEERDHVFFECRFAGSLWRRILGRLNQAQAIIISWDSMMTWLASIPSKDRSTLAILASQATVYHIWRHRNNLLHNGVRMKYETVFGLIDRDIRNAISGRRSRKRWRRLMELWFSSL